MVKDLSLETWFRNQSLGFSKILDKQITQSLRDLVQAWHSSLEAKTDLKPNVLEIPNSALFSPLGMLGSWEYIRKFAHYPHPIFFLGELILTSPQLLKICFAGQTLPTLPLWAQARICNEVREAAAIHSCVRENNQRIFPKFVNGSTGPGGAVMTCPDDKSQENPFWKQSVYAE